MGSLLFAGYIYNTKLKDIFYIYYLLGGGFALAEGSNVSGMAKMLGNALSIFKVLPHYLMLGCVLILTSFLTLFASNVATCNILIPIYAEMVSKIHIIF